MSEIIEKGENVKKINVPKLKIKDFFGYFFTFYDKKLILSKKVFLQIFTKMLIEAWGKTAYGGKRAAFFFFT